MFVLRSGSSGLPKYTQFMLSCVELTSPQHTRSGRAYDTNTYVRDADHLSMCLHETTVGPHDILVTYDIVNLYPSIPHELCIEMVAQHLRKVRTNVDFLEIGSMLSDNFILTMLRLVLRLNFCVFMGVVYRQINGYATGTACGGQVAHLDRVGSTTNARSL